MCRGVKPERYRHQSALRKMIPLHSLLPAMCSLTNLGLCRRYYDEATVIYSQNRTIYTTKVRDLAPETKEHNKMAKRRPQV